VKFAEGAWPGAQPMQRVGCTGASKSAAAKTARSGSPDHRADRV